MGQKEVLFLRILLLLALFTGCSNKEQKSETRLVLDWLPNPNHVALYAGASLGIFEKHGIKIQLLKTPEKMSGLAAVVSDRADLAISYMPSTLRAQKKGLPVVTIAKLIDQPLNSIIFRRDEKVMKPSDLSGKRLGYCIDGSTQTLDFILSQNHIVPSFSKNCHFDLVGMLASQHIDAIYGGFWNIELAQLNAQGIEADYFSFDELHVPFFYELVIVSKEGFNQAEAFRAALQECIDFSRSNKELAFDLYLAMNPDKSAKTKEWEYLAWETTVDLLAHDQELDHEVVTTFKTWLNTNNL